MAEHNVTMENTLQVLLEGKKYTTIRDILVTMNPADIAAVFNGLTPEQLPLLFRLLPKELAAESFVEMESEEQESLIRRLLPSLRSPMSWAFFSAVFFGLLAHGMMLEQSIGDRKSVV